MSRYYSQDQSMLTQLLPLRCAKNGAKGRLLYLALALERRVDANLFFNDEYPVYFCQVQMILFSDLRNKHALPLSVHIRWIVA